MPTAFSLVIEYLTGYAVATDPASRERAEWPPHPARVFMALAAAHFETDPENLVQRQALEWLSALPPPRLTIPEHSLRDVLSVYVPVNDQSGVDALCKRSRQSRTFPRVYVGGNPLRQTWEIPADSSSDHLEALESVCRNVTRIGHSSSLVWVRIERNSDVESTHVPDEQAPEHRLRIVQPGALQRLETAFNKSNMDDYAGCEQRILTSKGKTQKTAKDDLKKRFPAGRPTSQRPTFSIRSGYRLNQPPDLKSKFGQFDPDFIVLKESLDSTQSFGLESTAQLTEALRKLLMRESGVQPVPPWVGGHEASGEKLTSQGHLAIIPLPFVGLPWSKASQHADGHLLGLGIVLPRGLSYRERASVFSSVMFNQDTNDPKSLELWCRSGNWRLERETDLSQKQTLRTATYTMPSKSWASVTPVLLDRLPKADRVQDPVGWRIQVAEIISDSCAHQGLPQPIAVRVEKTAFFIGSLRAMPGQGGFPQLRKGKFQVHVQIEFDQPVQGPLLLGAGRFRGYGLLRPWRNEGQQ